MATYYTIIQYVPDPVVGERVNVGVAAYGKRGIRIKFLTDWRRVNRFCGKDAPVPDRIKALFRGINPKQLPEMIRTWNSAIQLTQPSVSLRTLTGTIEMAAKRFLVQPARKARTQTRGNPATKQSKKR
jgi:hypothetical protein